MNELTREQTILLNLAARSVSSDPSSLVMPFSAIDGVDWETIFQETKSHAIALICMDGAVEYKAQIPSKTYSDWKNYALRQIKRNSDNAQAQADLVELLDGYQYAILKGTVSASYYPRGDLRAFGDVDFLIENERQKELIDLLEKNGYVRTAELHETQAVFQKEGVLHEMHFSISGIPTGEIGEKIRGFLSPVLKSARELDNGFCIYRAPIDLYHGVIILLHTVDHNLREGLGLRHLCDWAAYVSKTKDMPFWTELIAFLEEVGLLVYAKTITKTCAKYLAIDCPKWAEDADEQVCDELIFDVLQSGNFGRKDKSYTESGVLIAKKNEKKRGTISTLIRALHSSILFKYPIVKKVWILYPFIFAWKVIKNLVKMLFGKRASIAQIAPKAQQRQQIYDKLHVFEKENAKE